MNTKHSYEELAATLAHCVYRRLHIAEPYRTQDGHMTTKMTVDNLCSSGLQIPTGILNRLGILRPLDDLKRRNEFTCAPAEFAQVIARNKVSGGSYDALVLALTIGGARLYI